MIGLSFGDLAQAYALKTRISSLKAQTTKLSQELSTGITSDVGKKLSGDLRGLATLEHARTVLAGHLVAGQQAAIVTKAKLTAFERMSDHIADVQVALATVSQDSSHDQIKRASDAAKGKFADAIRDLNTQIAGRPIFGGMASNGHALAPSDEILVHLAALTSGVTSAAEIESRVLNWFTDQNGFGSIGYRGAAAAPATQLAADGTSVTDQTAADPRVAQALAGLAIASLMDHPGLSPSGADRMALKQAALTQLSSGADATVDLTSQIGSNLATIDLTLSRHQAEKLTLEMAISELVTAEPERTATELEAVRTNLETVYAVTARISRLSLAEFLR